LGKPETFNFLGFTHICGCSRQGHFLLIRQTRRDRMQAKLRELKTELRKRIHQPIPVPESGTPGSVRGLSNGHPYRDSTLSGMTAVSAHLVLPTLHSG